MENMSNYIAEIQSLSDVICLEQIETPEQYAEAADTYRLRYRCDECEVEGYLALPKTFIGPLPAVIFNRGGNRDFAPLNPIWVSRFASYGYISLGSQYRGNCGGTGQEQFGGADVNDVIKLIDMALQLSFVRKEGVYMSGHSRGGMMTYLACARDARIKAAVVGAGVADAFIMYETREQAMKEVYHDLVGGGPETHRDNFIARSGTYWAEKIIPPMLICQGTADWRVVPEQSRKMYEKLQEAGKESKLIIYEGADHSLQGTSYFDDIVAWFRAHPLA